MGYAFNYISKKGQNYEQNYPYTSGYGQTGYCQSWLETGDVRVTNYRYISRNNARQLKAALNTGAVSVAIQADQPVFQYYNGGILTSAACGTNLDHGVVVVGYGDNYYIVRNSWGPSWGEGGYVRIGIQNGAGVCGIQMQPVQPFTN